MATIENQEQWKCRSCVEVFDTRGKRDAHQRKVHQKAATGRSERLQVQCSGTGRFVSGTRLQAASDDEKN